jgi:hypothetical protein
MIIGLLYDNIMRPTLSSDQESFTIEDTARFFMRHPRLSEVFAPCVYYFMTEIDNSRGNRNASYKQMNTSNREKVMYYNRLCDYVQSRMTMIRSEIENILTHFHTLYFHSYIVDWHAIVGQMPFLHRHFADMSQISDVQIEAAATVEPKWYFVGHNASNITEKIKQDNDVFEV